MNSNYITISFIQVVTAGITLSQPRSGGCWYDPPVAIIRGHLSDLRLAVIADDGNRVAALTDKDRILFIIRKDLRYPV